MLQSTGSESVRRGTPRASLAALGLKLQQLDFFAPVREQVRIPQKTMLHSPTDKLYHAFVATLAGARGMVEVDRQLRADPALQAAFGCPGCAEQSVIQDTLNACPAAAIAQMEAATAAIYQQHARSYRHDYGGAYQLLDVDLTGMPCGRKAEFATKGYFAKQPNRRGRQLGRVLASGYDEIVVDRLFEGNTSLTTTLVPLLEEAERVLELDEGRRPRTIVRVDAGGGTLEQVNWVLARGYEFHGKDFSSGRARRLAESVTEWIDDPRVSGRQVGWVRVTPTEYVRPVRRVAVRCRKANGQWGVGVLLSTLTAKKVLALTQPERKARKKQAKDPAAVLLAYVYFYDGRGGPIESSVRQDKQGLGITKRNKKRFAAQQMVVQLNVLAHNVLIWARNWLAAVAPKVTRLGIQRLGRDLFGIAGIVEQDPAGSVVRIILNEADRMAHRWLTALSVLVGQKHGGLILGQT